MVNRGNYVGSCSSGFLMLATVATESIDAPLCLL